MEDDDLPVGSVLTRRDALRLLGLTGAGLIVGCRRSSSVVDSADGRVGANVNAAGVRTCIARPEIEEGPFFVDKKLNRSDIRSDPDTAMIKQGIQLTLTFLVSSIAKGACAPLKDATIDIWQCDAQGNYSDASTMGMATKGQKFLRGYQETDDGGGATFWTIYPGWYRGRTVHIHMKVRTKTASGQAYEFTSQLFFDDALSNQIFTDWRYERTRTRDTTNATDRLFKRSRGQLTLQPVQNPDGYAATFNLALDLGNAEVGKVDSPPPASGRRGK